MNKSNELWKSTLIGIKRLLLSFFFIGMFFIHPVSALLSPSTLEILRATAGPYIVQIFVSIAATLALFFTRIKRRKIYLVITIFTILLISVLFIIRWNSLLALNTPDDTYLMRDLLVFSKEDLIDNIDRIQLDLDHSKKRYIDLDSLEPEALKEYELVEVYWGTAPSLIVSGARQLDFIPLWSAIQTNQSAVTEYLLKKGIPKNHSLIIMCNLGWRSNIISYFLTEYGIDAYFSSFNSIDNPDLIARKIPSGKLPIIDSIGKVPPGDLVLFLFGIDESFFICRVEDLCSDDMVSSRIKPIDFSGDNDIFYSFHHTKRFNLTSISKADTIICLSPLHCLLTQSAMSGSNNKIYYVGTQEQWERT